MTVSMIVGLAVATLAIGLMLNAAILRLCGYALSFPRATWKKSLLAAITLLGLSAAISVLTYFAPAARWVLLLSDILLAYIVIRGLIGTTRGRSWAATLLWLVGSSAAAFGQAILIRDYLVEPFVVPTGAMATTILGWHADVTCEDCGCRFSVSVTAYIVGPGNRERPTGQQEVVCRNCGHRQAFEPPPKPMKGDRILADKTGFPRRWDIATFRYPPRGQEFPPNQGDADGVSRVTYVKRLVGLPGETLQLAGGDVFIDGRRLQKQPGEQEDLWFPVFDSQYVPTTAQPAWRPTPQSSHWGVQSGISFDGMSQEVEELAFGRPIDTAMAYNCDFSKSAIPAAVYPTADVRVTCELAEFSGDGGFGFSWAYGGMSARITVAASGELAIDFAGGGAEDDPDVPLEKPRPVAAGQRWSFAHRDGRIYVQQDGRTVANKLVGSNEIDVALARAAHASGDTSESAAADAATCRIQLLAHHCRVRFARVSIDRDVYYDDPSEGSGSELEPARKFRLNAAEYFLLGDNSGHSADSRVWGAAHRSDFTGVVRAIFWPPSRWRAFP